MPLSDIHPALTDDDVPLGSFCKVTGGPYDGRYGVFVNVGDEKNGRPLIAIVRTRDDYDENITVDYKHIRPDTPGKR